MFPYLIVHFGVFVDEGVVLLVEQKTRETFEGQDFVQPILSVRLVTLKTGKGEGEARRTVFSIDLRK